VQRRILGLAIEWNGENYSVRSVAVSFQYIMKVELCVKIFYN
jgi:hypothetical protein